MAQSLSGEASGYRGALVLAGVALRTCPHGLVFVDIFCFETFQNLQD